MTVAEHILFYSLLKGRNAKEAQEEVEDMLQNLALRHKKTELAQNLSGLSRGRGSGPLRSVLGVRTSQVYPGAGGQNLSGLSWGRGSGPLRSVLGVMTSQVCPGAGAQDLSGLSSHNPQPTLTGMKGYLLLDIVWFMF